MPNITRNSIDKFQSPFGDGRFLTMREGRIIEG